MIKVLIQVEIGSSQRRIYNERTLEYKETRLGKHPYPSAYGFIPGTSTEDGDCVDCFLLSKELVTAGSIVECEPLGLLEQHENDEIDHKVLAILPGEDIRLRPKVLEELTSFIHAIFSDYPGINVRVGPIHSRKAALKYIEGLWANGLGSDPNSFTAGW